MQICADAYSKCEVCEKTFASVKQYDNHQRCCNMKTYLCVVCYKEFSHSVSLKNHAKLHYPPNKTFICPKCSAVCLTDKDLQSHIS